MFNPSTCEFSQQVVASLSSSSTPSPPIPAPPALDPPSWADQLEAWATLGAAAVALAAAIATIWLLVHQIRETRRARAEAHRERTEAAGDRELARDERREAERAQARTILFGNTTVRSGPATTEINAVVTNFGTGPIVDVSIYYLVPEGHHVLKKTVVLAQTGSLKVDTAITAGQGRLTVFFTDMAGRIWARFPDQQPTPAGEIDLGPQIR